MFDRLISFIAPHHCYSCSISGTLLCLSCEYNIISEMQLGCFSCGLPSVTGVCRACANRLPFSHAYGLGVRKHELEHLLNDFKFKRAYRIHSILGELFDKGLPAFPENTVVVPIPTIAPHIRIRGYDHTDLIARSFARRRNLKKIRLLRRKTNSVQLGANAQLRRKQADSAYECQKTLLADVPYLIIDDIATTGSTLVAAARCLKSAGATTIIVAIIARQTLKLKG